MHSLLIPAFTKGFALSAGLIIAIGAQNMFVLRGASMCCQSSCSAPGPTRP
jgi:arginine exporter protein ArgO